MGEKLKEKDNLIDSLMESALEEIPEKANKIFNELGLEVKEKELANEEPNRD